MRSSLPVAACVAVLAAGLAILPTRAKGIGPRPALDNLLAARTLALAGVPAIEDAGGHGVILGTAEARSTRLVPTAAGNRLSFQVYGRAMSLVPELRQRPHHLTALLAALAAGLVALLGARHGGWRLAATTGLLYVTLPVVWVSASSPAHLDLACLASAAVWALVLGPARPRAPALLLAGALAGLAALARDSFVVLAPMAALALTSTRSDEGAPPPGRVWRGVLLLCVVAGGCFVLGGGLHSVYLDPTARGREFHRLGHAFPDVVTCQVYLERAAGTPLTASQLQEHELLRDLDPRLAALYAGLGDPTPGGAIGQLLVRAGKSLRFYPRTLLTLDTFGGPLLLGLALLGMIAAPGSLRRSTLARALLGGLLVFLIVHAGLGTSNDSHLVVLAPPLALAGAVGLHAVVRALRAALPTRGSTWLLPVLAVGLVLAQQTLASRVALGNLYNGAGASHYGTSTARERALAVAAWPEITLTGRVLVGSRGEDALAIAWLADRSALVLAPHTLRYLARRGELGAFLDEHRVELLAGYPGDLRADPRVRAALGARPVLVWPAR